MPEILLPGCGQESLLGYLKALGVFRVVSEQYGEGSSSIRGFWRGGLFGLEGSEVSAEALVDFFLDAYRPAPLVTPWNRGSGFWGGSTASAVLDAVATSTHPRLATYRETIAATRAVLERMGLEKSDLDKTKRELLRQLRSVLPDEAVRWIDALAVIGDGKVAFAPVLGTGGNDGHLEFSVNFMQRLAQVVPLTTQEAESTGRRRRGQRGYDRDRSRAWLILALFRAGDAALVPAAVGQYHPGGVGGPNAVVGFEGPSLVNPWDYVLAMEGSLLLAGSLTRRSGLAGATGGSSSAAFPFTVAPSPAGWPTIEVADVGSARQEIWLPVWQRPASLREIQHVLAEGRAEVGRRRAANGADFVRAVAQLGVDRGLSGFVRYGFLQRSGRSYLASPLGVERVAERPKDWVELLDARLDAWVARFRRWAMEETAPASRRAALRELDESIFRFSRAPGGEERARAAQALLAALHRAETLAARSAEGRRLLKGPLPALRPARRWVEVCDDGSVEFRLARAVASLAARWKTEMDDPGLPAARTYVGFARLKKGSGWEWADPNPHFVWSHDDLEANLLRLLQRRLIDAIGTGDATPAPLAAAYPVRLEDVARWLRGAVDDDRIAELIPGLTLLDYPSPEPAHQAMVGPPARRAQGGCQGELCSIDPLYALFKPFFHAQPLAGPDGNPLPLPPVLAILIRLRQGGVHQVRQAVDLALTRWRAAGIALLGTAGRRATGSRTGRRTGSRTGGWDVCWTVSGRPARLAAALAFPITSVGPLLAMIMRPDEREGVS
ncbi:MAG: type I-U CRISPR-associated protein Csx17 [Chloroflexi bacterium]|nr:type I-U CRISPR-associated protein Csx17 [Chloroflexota bacterium]